MKKEHNEDAFDLASTTGYTLAEIKKLNSEWVDRVKQLKLEPQSDDYNKYLKQFRDEVARR